ncbi:hypothetical protein [Piscirickettsia litoralis]|uniref:hypothetical protein n=1 Tax=Piscirickettsia litoralis TaxID=1891921 RepID=UPI0013010FAD|nr:hypothetical protein [Piscirickettsia litoralis]
MIFFELIAAFTGVVLVIAGLISLKGGKNQQQEQGAAKIGVSYLVFGGALLTIGTLAVILSNTINHPPTSSNLLPGVPTPTTPTNMYDAIIVYLLNPFLHLVNVISPVLGIGALGVGVHRLRHHANPRLMSMHRRSPMASGFYFFVGAVLTCPNYLIEALSGSLFRTPQLIDSLCGTSNGEGFLSYFNDLSSSSILVFSDGKLQCAVANAAQTNDENLIKLAYAILFVVGLISFMRGIFLLIKLGEHMGGQDASLSRIVAHVLAGIVAINASVFIDILSQTYHLITGLTI